MIRIISFLTLLIFSPLTQSGAEVYSQSSFGYKPGEWTAFKFRKNKSINREVDISYRVVSGDTISSICRLFDVNQRDLLELNGLSVDHILQINQIIKLPPGSFYPSYFDPLTGARVQLSGGWVGTQKVKSDLPILLLAGHADSQGIPGSGTAGAAVDLLGARPMDKSMRDELYWNIKIRDAILKLGLQNGLNVRSYDPVQRTIVDENDLRTNWSVGSIHAQNGGYPLEIHFDAYGKYGFGSGLIPAISTKLNTVDESLARKFGRYPINFRDGLGAPRRNIRILEIGKLEGELENKLRNPESREQTINQIAWRVTKALIDGIESR